MDTTSSILPVFAAEEYSTALFTGRSPWPFKGFQVGETGWSEKEAGSENCGAFVVRVPARDQFWGYGGIVLVNGAI